MKINRYIIAGASMIAIAAPAVAQTASAKVDDDASREEIIVTAQRRAERLQDIPVSIDTVSAEKLGSSNAVSIVDLPTLTTGLIISNTGGFSQIYLRGVGTPAVSTGDEPNVATYIDGIYQPSSRGNIFDFFGIERIDVLKGPQGTIYGRNATGGAINIVTRAPTFTPQMDLEATAAEYGEIDLKAYVNTPLSKSAALNVSALKSTSDGFARNTYLDRRVGGRNNTGIRAKLLWRPTDNLDITIAGNYANNRDLNGLQSRPGVKGNLNSVGILVASQLGIPVPDSTGPREILNNFESRNHLRSWGGSITAVLSLSPFDITSISSYSGMKVRVQQDLDQTPAALLALKTDRKNDTYAQDIFLTSNANSPLEWIIGANIYHSKTSGATDIFQGQFATGTTLVLQHTSLAVETNSYAAFAELTYHVTDRLRLIGGARYTSERKQLYGTFGTGEVLPGLPDHPQVGSDAPPVIVTAVDKGELKKTWKRATFRASALYDVGDGTNFYATFSQGFKSGNFSNANALGPETVKPERINAYEIGAKSDPTRPLSFTVSGYYYDYSNIQVDIFTATGQSMQQNAAKARIYGGEGTLSVRPFRGLDLSMSAAYTNAKYKDYPNAVIYVPVFVNGLSAGNAAVTPAPNVGGAVMIRAPKWTGNVNASYKFDLAGGMMELNANAQLSSKIFYDAGNRITQPGFALINMRVGWTTPDEHFTAAVFVRNLTNKDILSTAQAAGQLDTATYQAPRVVGGSLAFHF